MTRAYFLRMNSVSSHVNILIPLAGKGQRFKNVGFKNPKPLIKINGRSMLEWAMDSFNFLNKVKNFSLIFIVNKKDVEEFSIDKKILKLYPRKSTIVVIKRQTQGQAQTCLHAKSLINTKDKLFIYNCDTFSISGIWDVIKTKDPDGAITYFNSNDNRYSYAKVNKQGFVTKVAEKESISDMASTGMYYFKHGSSFVKAAENMIKSKNLTGNEYYVMPCYTDLIAQGKKILCVKAKQQVVFGTPEELIAARKKLKT